jgi:hypothetical protein
MYLAQNSINSLIREPVRIPTLRNPMYFSCPPCGQPSCRCPETASPTERLRRPVPPDVCSGSLKTPDPFPSLELNPPARRRKQFWEP